MFLICGLGIGASLPCLDALITNGIEKGERGTVSSIYSSMRFIGVAAGPGFDKVENVIAIIKTAAIIMFIIMAAAAVFGWIHGDVKHPGFPNSAKETFS